MTNQETQLLKLLPRVLRARDFHLYTEGGKRLTDLWLQGGRAILGHKPPQVLRELKNAAERGLFAPFPHPMENRFIKALGELFQGRGFRLYPDTVSLYRALEKAGFAEKDDENGDCHHSENGDCHLWRPFIEEHPDNLAPVLIPVLPLPLGPEVLVLEKSAEASFPTSELIPPVLLAPAARALYDLIAVLKAKNQNRGQYLKIEKVLREQKPGGLKSGGGFWRRQGIYLTLAPCMEREEYAALFRNFLEGGFLIPPSQLDPLILPPSLSPGEESKLAALLKL